MTKALVVIILLLAVSQSLYTSSFWQKIGIDVKDDKLD